MVDRVFLASVENDHVIASDSTSRADMLSELGYDVADNLVSDVVVLVEGPTDIPVLEEFLVKKGTLASYSVKMWPLGGDIMQDIDLSVMMAHKKVIALIDNDPGSRKARARFKKNCDKAGVPVVRLKRYAIENYFTVAALRAVFKAQISATLTGLNPDEPLERQLGMNVKKNNRKIAREMLLADIADTDLGKFVDRVDTLCRR